tara:strand:- start:3446 stop:4255 length:810 start_codon:yes stop_codon:yes gene_type:complete
MRLLYLLFILLFTSCGIQWQYSTLNHAAQIDSIYRSNDYQVDTISSVSDLRYKLRTDFNFRYDFAQYAMNQPYSFYWNNPRLEGIWRPYNRFDVYFHSNWFWNDWAYNYPFHHTWGWNNWYNWNRPYYYYGWNRPYNSWNNWYQGPFNNPGYNVVWNSSRRGRNIAYINGNRTSNNISNRLVLNRKKPRVNINKPLIIPNINNNSRPRINNNNIIRIKPNNNNYKPNNNYSRPTFNNNPRPSTTIRTTPSNSTRSSNNTTVRSNSRGKN